MAFIKDETEDVKIEEAFRVKQEDTEEQTVQGSFQMNRRIKVESEDVKIEEAFRVKREDTEEQTDDKGSIRTTISKRTFIVPKGLQVCFLTDSVCWDIEHYFPNAQCWVHPDTTLVRSVQEHVKHFERLHNYTIVILHIGANDITSGAPASTIVQRMKDLISRISQVNSHILYFAISAILPRVKDDSVKTTTKQCNSLLQHWSSQTRNILFLDTKKAFLKNGKIIQNLYKDDGLHLNQEGKQKLFSYFQRFLWHFCQFSSPARRA